MKIANIMAVAVVGSLITLTTLQAAPVESVESVAANPARQKVTSYLNEQAVSAQLTKLGVSAHQVEARLAKLNDAQLAQVAAQIDQVKVGGDIQAGNPHPLGPIECVLNQIGYTIKHIFQVLFCWNDIQ